MKLVVIVTYGRSGSTLLKGLLNSVDGVSVSGENYLALFDLYKFYSKMVDSLRISLDTIGSYVSGDACPWFNCFDIGVLDNNVRNLVFDLFDPDCSMMVVGFKEIRWHKLGVSDFDGFIKWFDDLFDCRFVFLTRNLDDVSRSEWFKDKDSDSVVGMLDGFEHRVFSHIDGFPEQSWFHIDYGDIISGDVGGLGDFLGISFDSVRVEEVLATPHSYKSVGRIRTSKNNFLGGSK